MITDYIIIHDRFNKSHICIGKHHFYNTLQTVLLKKLDKVIDINDNILFFL